MIIIIIITIIIKVATVMITINKKNYELAGEKSGL
jgi:hypothetical protein